MREEKKKGKIAEILIQVDWENSGTIWNNIHGNFIFGMCVLLYSSGSQLY